MRKSLNTALILRYHDVPATPARRNARSIPFTVEPCPVSGPILDTTRWSKQQGPHREFHLDQLPASER